jgi:hypothetical protein
MSCLGRICPWTAKTRRLHSSPQAEGKNVIVTLAEAIMLGGETNAMPQLPRSLLADRQ